MSPAKPFYPYPEWENDPDSCVYLGSEKNPRTGYKYDYWLIQTNELPAQGVAGRYSATYRFGLEDPDYGSMPLCICWYDDTHFGADIGKDHLFGSYRVKQLALYYLATGKRPLIEQRDGFDDEEGAAP